MKYLLNYTMMGISIFLISLMMVSLAYSSEREYEHKKHYRHSYPVVEYVAEKVEPLMPMVQHQFNPDSKKYQLSIGMATADFQGNTALGISMGKRICNAECESAFWHGSLNSNGSQTSGGIGVTFSWD